MQGYFQFPNRLSYPKMAFPVVSSSIAEAEKKNQTNTPAHLHTPKKKPVVDILFLLGIDSQLNPEPDSFLFKTRPHDS